MHLPLDNVVEDVVDGRVRLAQAALRRAHGLQPVPGDHLVDGGGDLARRHLLVAAGVEQPLGRTERLVRVRVRVRVGVRVRVRVRLTS